MAGNHALDTNTSNSATCICSDTIWDEWISIDNSTCETWQAWVGYSSNKTWDIWADATQSIVSRNHRARFKPPPPPTEEELRQHEERRKKHEEEDRQRCEAEARATRLFQTIITPEQFNLFGGRGYHEVIGPSGVRYRLRKGERIDVMEGNFGDKVKHKLCIHHPHELGLPAMDTLIHQLLLIVSGQEDELNQIANKHMVA